MATQEEIARLAAGAQSGQAGITAYENAMRDTQASRDAAIAGLQQEVSAIGGGAGVMEALRGKIDRPVERALEGMRSGQAFHAADLSRIGQQSEAYGAKVSSALPLLSKEIEQTYARTTEGAERAHAMELARIRGEYDVRLREEQAAKGGGGGGGGGRGGGGGGGGYGDLSDSELRGVGLGLAEMARNTRAQGMAARSQTTQKVGAGQAAAAATKAKDRPGAFQLGHARAQRVIQGAAVRKTTGKQKEYNRAEIARNQADRARANAASVRARTGGMNVTIPGARQEQTGAAAVLGQGPGVALRAIKLGKAPKPGAEAAARARYGQAAGTERSMFGRLRKAETAAKGRDAIQMYLDWQLGKDEEQMNRLASGEGLATDVQEQLIAAGIEPERAYGVFGPTEEATEVAARRKLLGLPTLAESAQGPAVSDVTIPASQAATQLGIKPAALPKLMGSTHMNPTEIQRAITESDGQWTAEMLADPKNQAQAGIGPTPVVGDIIESAGEAVLQGMDYETFQATVARSMGADADPEAVRLALAMVAPRFAYRQAQTRNAYFGGQNYAEPGAATPYAYGG